MMESGLTMTLPTLTSVPPCKSCTVTVDDVTKKQNKLVSRTCEHES